MADPEFRDQLAIAKARQAQCERALEELVDETIAFNEAAYALLNGLRARGIDDGTAVLNMQGIANTIAVIRLSSQR